MTDPHLDERPQWAADAVFYNIFPDRFANGDPTLDPPGTVAWGTEPNRTDFQGGDLVGLRDRLDHLQRLGVTGIWLNPIFTAGSNHRYDTHDYLTVDPHLGDEALLKDVVHEAHQRGIRVLLDGVFNHCGDGFAPFRDVLANGPTSAYAEWFDVRSWPVNDKPPTYQTCGGAHYLPKLNTSNPQVRSYLLEVATYWIETVGIDGWRLDVPWKVPHDFWVEYRQTVRQAKPDAYLVGEIWRDPIPWLDVFDGTMDYRVRDVLLDYCVRDHMDAEDAALELRWLANRRRDAAPWMMNLLGCHDTPRVATIAGGRRHRVRLAQTMMLTLPGIPLLYYGDEIGLEGHDDPGCRAAMPADPAQWWTDDTAELAELIRIRHNQPALRHGDLTILTSFNGLLAYRRKTPDDIAVVVINVRNDEPDVHIPIDTDLGTWRDLLTGETVTHQAGSLSVGDLPAASARILVPTSTRTHDEHR